MITFNRGCLYLITSVFSLLACSAQAQERKLPSYSDVYGPDKAQLSPLAPRGKDRIHLQIGKYEYAIPANYFDQTQNLECAHKAALLFALFPKLEAKTPENRKEFQVINQQTKWTHILVNSDHGKVDTATGFKIAYNVVAGPESIYGPFEEPHDQYADLEVLKPTRKSLGKTIYVNKKGNEVASYSMCDVPRDVPNPGCEHVFPLNDAIVSFSYPLSQLENWRTLERSTKQFLHTLTTGPVTHSKPSCGNAYQ